MGKALSGELSCLGTGLVVSHLNWMSKLVKPGVMSHQLLDHRETGSRLKVSSARPEKMAINLATPGLVIQHVIHDHRSVSVGFMFLIIRIFPSRSKLFPL